MQKLRILVGSESGSAEMVADAVRTRLHKLGFTCEMDTSFDDASVLPEGEVLLVCCSTTGIGDLPQNIRPLFEKLETSKPSLLSTRFGIIGLGDRNYKESYLGGPKKWDALLASLGATRLGEILALDASEHLAPDEDAAKWVQEWVSLI